MQAPEDGFESVPCRTTNKLHPVGCGSRESLGSNNKPLQTGALIYISVKGRLDNAVKAVKLNGGKLVQDRQQIAWHGFRAVNLDLQANQIALHSSTA